MNRVITRDHCIRLMRCLRFLQFFLSLTHYPILSFKNIQIHKQQISVCSMIHTVASSADRKTKYNILDMLTHKWASDCPGVTTMKGRAYTLKQDEKYMSQ